MPTSDTVQRVRIYLNERDSRDGRPLYLLVMERLQREGATGATALRGMAGFGAGRRLTGAANDQALPVVIEWVDRADRVAQLLPELDDLLPDALITLEDVRLHRALLTPSGPFGERLVADALAPAPLALPRETSLAAALRALLVRPQPALPLLEADGRLGGLARASELVSAAGGLTLRLLAALSPEERDAALAELPSRTLAEIATAELRPIGPATSIAQAVGLMVEWGLEALPVVDDGRLLGLFGVDEALRAAVAAAGESGPPQPPVGLLMQRSLPLIDAATPAPAALAQLLAAPGRAVWVVEAGQPLGLLSDIELLERLPGALRTGWLGVLRAGGRELPPPLASALSERTAGALPLAPAALLGEAAPRDEALRRLLADGLERLAVVDAAGRLTGAVSRWALLRSLAQEGGR
jgi:PII-like signaling protein/predicted transcriptional regulator